jgi:3-oxoacyl-[acyl-carrier protein] reductase
MDLGIRGRTAIVCAASRGLGRVIAVALAREGVDLVINARSEAALAALAIRARASVRRHAAGARRPHRGAGERGA